MKQIDLNCDLGEGAGHDDELMPLISSANIACGAHAGNRETMVAAVRSAVACGTAVGAHPGYFDLQNFGRRERAIAPDEAARLVLTQIESIHGIAGDRLRHVKLHGALYNQVSADAGLAAAIVEGLTRHWPGLVLFALSGSKLARAGRAGGLRVAEEVFADRTYQRDGTLTPRARSDALITDEDSAVSQVLRMVQQGTVRAADGFEVPIRADTVCVHGDGLNAVAFARRLRAALAAAGLTVGPFGG